MPAHRWTEGGLSRKVPVVAREQAAHCQISSQRPHCAHPSKPRLQALQPGPFPLGASLVVQAGSSQAVAAPCSGALP